MKKIMGAMAAIAMATTAMGATTVNVDWSVYAYDVTEYAGYTGYLMKLSGSVDYDESNAMRITSWANVDAVKNAALDYGVVADDGWGEYKVEKTTKGITIDGQTDYFYLVVVTADESKFRVTDSCISTTCAYTEGKQPDGIVFADLSDSDTYSEFTGVPEPTSGLLMLVGGMLLGLRRKRA